MLGVLGKKMREGEGKMMLKIDEITHFLRIVKSQNTIRICVSEAQTSAQPRDFLRTKNLIITTSALRGGIRLSEANGSGVRLQGESRRYHIQQPFFGN